MNKGIREKLETLRGQEPLTIKEIIKKFDLEITQHNLRVRLNDMEIPYKNEHEKKREERKEGIERLKRLDGTKTVKEMYQIENFGLKMNTFRTLLNNEKVPFRFEAGKRAKKKSIEKLELQIGEECNLKGGDGTTPIRLSGKVLEEYERFYLLETEAGYKTTAYKFGGLKKVGNHEMAHY